MLRMSFLNSQKLPLVVKPEKEDAANFDLLANTVASRRDLLNEKLLMHGALLFRGYGVEDALDLEKLARLFSGKELLNYTGGVSPRNALNNSGIYNSTEYPSELTLSLHNELSYADKFPSHLFFCCFIAPVRGGETTLGDSRRILKNIDAEIIKLFKSKKICYTRNLQAERGSGYSWQEAFETDDKQKVENHCRKISASFEWKPDGNLRLTQIRPATVIHPVAKVEVWFNQAEGFHASNFGEEIYQTTPKDEFRLNSHFGDGSPIDLETLKHIRSVINAETIPHKWQTGDILVIDNILAAHGRMPFKGKRKISLAMT
jgi:alpha-ketoglutarate-dependent taurine dioxygenase